ncbi:MAG TPA: hypothetical protein VHM25_19565 [Polyangiaceae bacterium]|nr:hypothetical protein [Polyangiaceae bacterium]
MAAEGYAAMCPEARPSKNISGRHGALGVGYVELGPRARRVDLAERAAQALLDGSSESDALRCLSIPRRDAARVLRALREFSPTRAGAA